MRKGFAGSSFVVAVWLAVSVASAQDPEIAPAAGEGHPLIAPPKPLSAMVIHTSPRIAGKMPGEVKQPSETLFDPTPLATSCYSWPADCPYGRYYFLCHDPLFTEDVALERYGCALPCYAQPVVSCVKYLITVPTMPVKAVVHTCYRDGYCRDCFGQLRPGYCECGCKPWWCTTGCQGTCP